MGPQELQLHLFTSKSVRMWFILIRLVTCKWYNMFIVHCSVVRFTYSLNLSIWASNRSARYQEHYTKITFTYTFFLIIVLCPIADFWKSVKKIMDLKNLHAQVELHFCAGFRTENLKSKFAYLLRSIFFSLSYA